MKRAAIVFAIFWSVVYTLLFPVVIHFSLAGFMIFDRPGLSTSTGLAFVLMIYLIPLSMPVSVDLMWSSYVEKKYNKTLVFWLIPWVTLAFVVTTLSLKSNL